MLDVVGWTMSGTVSGPSRRLPVFNLLVDSKSAWRQLKKAAPKQLCCEELIPGPISWPAHVLIMKSK